MAFLLPGTEHDAGITFQEAYLQWLRAHQKDQVLYAIHFRSHGFWRNVARGVVSSLTLFPSTANDMRIKFKRDNPDVSIEEALLQDWGAVGHDLYSAFVKDRIKI